MKLSLGAICAIGLLFSSTLKAEGAASASKLESPESFWSTAVAIQGSSSSSGLTIGGESPLFWKLIGLHLGVSLNQAAGPVNSYSFTYEAAQFGIRLRLNEIRDLHATGYLMENLNMFFGTQGFEKNSFGFETCYGLELRGLAGNETMQSVFVEMGIGTSAFRTSSEFGGSAVGAGLVSRLGYRRFF